MGVFKSMLDIMAVYLLWNHFGDWSINVAATPSYDNKDSLSNVRSRGGGACDARCSDESSARLSSISRNFKTNRTITNHWIKTTESSIVDIALNLILCQV